MRTMILLAASFLVALVFAGCNREDNSLTAPGHEKSNTKVSVPWKGNLDGTVYPKTEWNCGTGTLARFGDGYGELAHLGNSYGEFEYCVRYTSQTSGVIVPRTGRINFIEAANGDKVYLIITGGTFQLAGTMDYNGKTYLKVTGTILADIDGGTGRFENAEGSVECTAIQLMELVNPMANPALCFTDWTGTFIY